MFLDLICNLNISAKNSFFSFLDIGTKQALTCVCKMTQTGRFWPDDKNRVILNHLVYEDKINMQFCGYNNVFKYKIDSCCNMKQVHHFLSYLSAKEKKKLHEFLKLYFFNHKFISNKYTRMWRRVYWDQLRRYKTVCL